MIAQLVFMKRSIILAIVLLSPLLICLVDQMAALAVPVTRTVTLTTTITTTETDVETSTLSWTYSEFSTVPATRTTTITTTATMMLPVWKVTTVTWPITSTKTVLAVTTKLTTRTTTKTVTITVPWPPHTLKIPVTSTYTTSVAVLTWRTTTTTSTFTGTTTQLVVVPIVIYGTLTTAYPTETLTTILSTSASTVTMAEVGTKTYTQTLTIPYVTEEAAPPTRMCIIASAAYNSELAPEVQFLRSFRDNVVMSTESGRSFMTIFNRWYYSFSPQVARLLSENELLKGVVRVSLYPLLGALFIAAGAHSVLAFNPELAAVAAGLIAAILAGLFYLFPPLVLVSGVTRRRKVRKQ